MAKPKGPDSIDDMLKWEKKQYTPWEYAQEGKLTPFLKARGSSGAAAFFFFAQGGALALIFTLMLCSSGFADNWIQLLILAACAALSLMAAVNYLKKWRAAKLLQKKGSRHWKKKRP